MSEQHKACLVATGDILLHKNVLNKARQGTKYVFDSMFEQVIHDFKCGDITLVNQESLIGGASLGLLGYPKFNSPVELGYFLQASGVDIVNIANNHVLDKKEKGLFQAISNLDNIGLQYTGAYKSQKDRDRIRLISSDNIKFAFISYTDGNKIKKPEGMDYLVNTFDGPKVSRRLNAKIKKMKDDIKAAKKIADIIVLSIHFGEEYHRFPNGMQREIAYSMSDTGADIILGHHSHVLQPPEWIVNSKGSKSFVAYSLGNFFSGQKGLYRQIGAILQIGVEKCIIEGRKELRLTQPKMRLTYVDSNDKKDFKIYYLEELVRSKSTLKANRNFDSSAIYNDIKSHLRTYISDFPVT